MQIETNKEKIYINKVIGQKYDSFVIEEDFVVPDVKPDVLSIINTSGIVCVYKKEILDEKIKIDGCINTYIMYLADGEKSCVRGLNTNLDFSKIIDFKNIKQDMILECKVSLKEIECKIINGRKIKLSGIIEVNLKVSSNEEIEFINEIKDCKDIQLLNETMEINSMTGHNITKTYAKDTFMIDSVDSLLDVLKVDIKLINKEIKTSYNKILTKADACINIIYLTEDGRICSKNQLISVMGFIDIQDIAEDDIYNIDYEIKNCIIKPNNMEDHSIYVEIEYEIYCDSYNKKKINLIQDLYSPSIKMNYDMKKITAISEKKNMKDVLSIREKQTIPEIGSNKIINVDVVPIIEKQTLYKDKIVFEGEVELKYLFESNSSQRIDFKKINIPFNYSVEEVGITQNSVVDSNITVVLQDFTVMADDSVDVKIDMEFTISSSKNKSINVIDEINIDEKRNEERHSLVIYFVKQGDTLWNIAKKFGSTIQNIADINEIKDFDKLKIGEQLFIPITV